MSKYCGCARTHTHTQHSYSIEDKRPLSCSQMLPPSLTPSCTLARQGAVPCVHLQRTFMTDGRHLEVPSAITLPKGATTWNDKSLLCSFLLSSSSSFAFLLYRLLPQRGRDLTWHTVNDKTVTWEKKILEEGQLRKENYREDLDVLADEGEREAQV